MRRFCEVQGHPGVAPQNAKRKTTNSPTATQAKLCMLQRSARRTRRMPARPRPPQGELRAPSPPQAELRARASPPQPAAGGELSTCLSTPHGRRELSSCLSPPQASSARLSPPQASSKRPSPLQAALRIHSPPQAELRTPRPVPDRAPRASAAPLAPRDGHLPQRRRRIMVCTRRRRCSIWWPVTHTVLRSSAGPPPAQIDLTGAQSEGYCP